MTGKQTRRRILELMAAHERSRTPELIDSTRLAGKTGLATFEIERHLDILSQHGLIKSFKTQTSYSAMLSPEGWESLEEEADDLKSASVQTLSREVSDSLLSSDSRAEPPPARGLRAFLCHASGDKDEIRGLYHRLTADGIDAWLDEEKLLPGQHWEREIQKAVQAADVVLVCLSSRSINKAGFVQKEIKFALDVADEQPEGTIFVIPVRLEDCQVPDRLRQWQWVDLFEDRGYERLRRALRARAETVRVQPPQPSSSPEPRRDPDKAIEKFARSATFRDAKRNADELLKSEPFSAAQVDRILIAATTNDQIYLPDELRRPLRTLVARYGHLASGELRDRFFRIFNV